MILHFLVRLAIDQVLLVDFVALNIVLHLEIYINVCHSYEYRLVGLGQSPYERGNEESRDRAIKIRRIKNGKREFGKIKFHLYIVFLKDLMDGEVLRKTTPSINQITQIIQIYGGDLNSYMLVATL